MQDFDFNEWAELHKKDPAEFERRRQATLEKMISESPLRAETKQKLRTTVLAAPSSTDPMENMLNAQKLMWASFGELQAQVKQLHIAQEQTGEISVRKTAVATFTK
jgi:hypothetical protein